MLTAWITAGSAVVRFVDMHEMQKKGAATFTTVMIAMASRKRRRLGRGSTELCEMAVCTSTKLITVPVVIVYSCSSARGFS